MRAVFTVDLPFDQENGYPDDMQIIQYLRSFGWEPVEVCELVDEQTKLTKCREMANVLFQAMPPTAISRPDHVIYYGYLADDYTKFVALRLVDGQITFRLANDVLTRLQTSASKIIRKILNNRLEGKHLQVSNQNVVIYELGNDYIILSGRVIPHPLFETMRSDKKSVLLTIVPLIVFFFLATFVLLGISAENFGFLGGSLERISTALFTTSLVSFLSLVETYIEIYRNKIVAW